MTFFRELWRWITGRCIVCGGRLNTVYGFGPEWARRPNGNYVWCPNCIAKRSDP